MVIELIRIPVDPIKCIARIANQINLNQKVKQKAINIMNAATKSVSAGKNPMISRATELLMDIQSALDLGEHEK
jgi:transcription initiation factor TFIIIB Brf1 subunit/transcription initiation factor TFIIB